MLRVFSRTLAALLAVLVTLPNLSSAASVTPIVQTDAFPVFRNEPVGNPAMPFIYDHTRFSLGFAFFELSLELAEGGPGIKVTLNENGAITSGIYDFDTAQALLDEVTAPSNVLAALFPIPAKPGEGEVFLTKISSNHSFYIPITDLPWGTPVISPTSWEYRARAHVLRERIPQAPLPAGVWLLLTGAGALAGLRRFGGARCAPFRATTPI